MLPFATLSPEALDSIGAISNSVAFLSNPVLWIGIPAAVFGTYYGTFYLIDLLNHAKHIRREITTVTYENGEEVDRDVAEENLDRREAYTPENPVVVTQSSEEATEHHALCWYSRQQDDNPREYLGVGYESFGNSNAVAYSYSPTSLNLSNDRALLLGSSSHTTLYRDCIYYETTKGSTGRFNPDYLSGYAALPGTDTFVSGGAINSPAIALSNPFGEAANYASGALYGVASVASAYVLGRMLRSAWNYFTKPATPIKAKDSVNEMAIPVTSSVIEKSLDADAVTGDKKATEDVVVLKVAANDAVKAMVTTAESEALTSSFVVDCLVYMSSALLALSILLVAVGVLGLMGISTFIPPVAALCAGAVGIGVARTGLSLFASRNQDQVDSEGSTTLAALQIA